MDFEWDPNKAEINFVANMVSHSLKQGQYLEMKLAITVPDTGSF